MQKSELPTDQCSIVSARVELAVPQVEIEVYPSISSQKMPKEQKYMKIHDFCVLNGQHEARILDLSRASSPQWSN